MQIHVNKISKQHSAITNRIDVRLLINNKLQTQIGSINQTGLTIICHQVQTSSIEFYIQLHLDTR